MAVSWRTPYAQTGRRRISISSFAPPTLDEPGSQRGQIEPFWPPQSPLRDPGAHLPPAAPQRWSISLGHPAPLHPPRPPDIHPELVPLCRVRTRTFIRTFIRT
jgi:hypothetical protein